MNEQELLVYKKIYTEIEIPQRNIEENWELLSPLLPKQQKKDDYLSVKYGIAFLASIVVIMFGGIGVSLASKPGDRLYPVKTLTHKVTQQITSVFQEKVKKIAPQNEVIKSSPTNNGANKASITPTKSPSKSSASVTPGQNSEKSAGFEQVHGVSTQNNSSDNKSPRSEVKGTENQNKGTENLNNGNSGNNNEKNIENQNGHPGKPPIEH